MPPWEGIRLLIERNEPWALNRYPRLSDLITSGITIPATIQPPLTLGRYPDPSLAQYATVIGQGSCLQVLLERTDSASFPALFAPKTSNTKQNLLTLAVLEDRRDIVVIILDYIKKVLPGQTARFVNWESPDRSTSVTVAASKGRWTIVSLLIGAGGYFLTGPDGTISPFVRALIEDPAATEQFLQEPENAELRNQIIEAKWNSRTLMRDSEGVQLFKAVTEGLAPHPRITEIQKFVTALDPSAAAAPVVRIDRQPTTEADDANGPSSICAEPGCIECEGLAKCQKCKRSFCHNHFDDHNCQ